MLAVYSPMHRHIRRIAEAVQEGAGALSGADFRICRVLETLPEAEQYHCLRDHGYEPRSTLRGY